MSVALNTAPVNYAGAVDSSLSQSLDSALRAGHFEAARTLLAGQNEPRAVLERARLAFFLDNDLDTCEELSRRVLSTNDASNEQCLLARVFLGCVRASRGESIGPVLDAGDLRAIDPPALSEIIYYSAYASYFAREFERAQSTLEFHWPEQAEWQARYLVMRGLLFAARERFSDQARLTAEALDLLLRKAPDHAYLIANAARLLAVLVRDVPCVDGLERLERVYRVLGDDDGFTGSRFHVARSLGWARALRGEYRQAMGLVMRAMTDASSQIQRLYAHLDHVSIAVFAHEQASAAAHASFEIAHEIVASIDWANVVTDDLAALPLAAQAFAEMGAVEEARTYCNIARSRQGAIVRRLAMAHDGRYAAMVDEASALAYADADRKFALECATRAYHAYDRMGFAWRAARMAILLLQTTHASKWRESAEMQLQAYPESPFHRLLERPRTLTKREEDVLRLLRLGYDDYQIAESLGIAYKTVRIHVGRVFRWYGVRSRSALMAKAAASG